MDRLQFESVLIRLLRSSRLVYWPRKDSQKQVLLKSAALMLERGSIYTEREVDDLIRRWLDIVGNSVQIDHASVRRALVDEGYVVRDPAGRAYRLSEEPPAYFGADVDSVDVSKLMADLKFAAKKRRSAGRADSTT